MVSFPRYCAKTLAGFGRTVYNKLHMQENPHAHKEKRRAQRIAFKVDVCYKRGTHKEHTRTFSRDISTTGLRICAHHAFTPDEKIEVLISSPELGPRTFTAQGRVVWCRMIDKDNFETGVKLLKVNDEEEFMHSICGKMIDLSFEG